MSKIKLMDQVEILWTNKNPRLVSASQLEECYQKQKLLRIQELLLWVPVIQAYHLLKPCSPLIIFCLLT